jgi:hypothetical protein
MARPSASPTPPLDLLGVVTGISTAIEDPTIIIKTVKNDTVRLRMPRNQSVKTINLGDNVRAKGWPMGDGVMLATGVEVVYNKR